MGRSQMHNKQRGFTLVELAIVIVIGTLLVGVLASTCTGVLTADRAETRATSDALEYARTMYPGWQTYLARCQAIDSDGDGYVTCIVGNGQTTVAVECRHSLALDYARGCRPTRAVITRPE